MDYKIQRNVGGCVEELTAYRTDDRSDTVSLL